MATTTWTQTAGMTSDEDVDNVDSFAEQAEASKDAAAASATAAAASESAASASASSASASATTATTKAAEASTSATNAATSASSASSSATSATASETAAATSKNAAAASATAAAASETAAAASETAAASSETNAATSETNAATSATSASTSATTASTAATTASTAATNAATSETNAATSASTASTAATNAATSETNAATSETNAATSATNAATSETNAATSATSASTSASAASTSATAAAASQSAAAASAASAASAYDTFDDRYLGSKTADPTVDNDGNTLVSGALYFNSTANEMRVYDGANWIAATSAGNASLLEYKYTATSGQTTFSGVDDSSNTLSYTQDNLIVTLNGVVLENGTDYTATTGTSVVLASGAATSDELNVIAFKSFTTADMVSSANGGTFYNNIDVQGTVTADGLNVNADNTNAPQVVFENSHSVTTDAAISTYDDAAGVGITLGSNYYLNSAGSEARFNTSEESAGILVDRVGVITLKTDNSGSAVAKDRLNIAGNGDISFYEDTGTTAKFFWDASAESLGIGTTSPERDVTTTSLAVSGGGSKSASLDLYGTVKNYAIYSGGSGQLGFYNLSDSTERMRIDSSGNVGIGTSSPNNYSANHKSITLNAPTTPLIDLEVNGTRTGSFVADSTKVDLNAVTSVPIRFLTADTERMRIDSSGNLLVGKTSTSTTVAGIVLNDDGRLFATGEGGAGHQAARFTRLSNDGDIVTFYKDGTTVGSIGNSSTNLIVEATASNRSGLSFGGSVTPRRGGANSDNTTDLGVSSIRFKDLYLGGGVYLGGTGASNKLDDYEEGTWSVAFTPSTSGTITLTGGAFYTKIGQAVTINISVNSTAVSSPVGYISFNLPFAAASGSQKGRSALALYFDGLASGNNTADFVGLTIDGTSNGRIYIGDSSLNVSDSAQQIDGDSYMLISATYITSA